MNILNLADPRLFGNDAGEEEEPDVLASYFVDQPAFSAFLGADHRLAFARARKGMGKSALLSKLAHDLRSTNPAAVVVQCSGSDLTGLADFSSEDPSVLINQWHRAICAKINLALASKIGFEWKDSKSALVDNAEMAGFNGSDLLRSLLNRITGKKLPIRMSDSSAPLSQVVKEQKGQSIWLFVDDVDSTFEDTAFFRRKVSTFFSASRKIVRDVKGLYIRGSVRTDVWSMIRANEDLDKAEQYMTDIRWSRPEMETILAKRIYAYLKRLALRPDLAESAIIEEPERLIELAFEHLLNWGGNKVPAIQVVNILCAKRPRWMAQLCRRAGVQASKRGGNRINVNDIVRVMKQFGEQRLADLYKEHGHQCAKLQSVIECFADGPSRYSTAQMLERIGSNYLTRVPETEWPSIDGKRVDGALPLGHFLFRIGFLQGQSPGAENSGREFVDYEERPDLLTTYTNLDDGLVWAVYPSYRNVLRIGPGT